MSQRYRSSGGQFSAHFLIKSVSRFFSLSLCRTCSGSHPSANTRADNSDTISEQSESYEERQLAHAIMNQPRRPLDLDAFSQGLRIQSMDAEEMMDALRERLMRDFAASRGRLVAAREGTPLPWWLAR